MRQLADLTGQLAPAERAASAAALPALSRLVELYDQQKSEHDAQHKP